MWAKLLTVAFCLYVVQAAIAPDILDEQDNTIENNLVLADEIVTDSEVTEAKSGDCHWSWCTQYCRQRGYPYGSCVQGRCQCYRRRSEMPAEFQSVTEFENTLDVSGNKMNSDVSEAKSSDCNWNWCEQHCRTMGYADGTCRNGHCYCYRHRDSVSAQPKSFIKNENTLDVSGNKMNSEVSESKASDCTWNWCEQHCRSMGYADGTCRNGRCYCYRHRDSVSAQPKSFIKNANSFKDINCDWRSCNQNCRQRGYYWGSCQNGRCECYGQRPQLPAEHLSLMKEDSNKDNFITLINKVSEASSDDCNWNWCNQNCRQHGYSYGTCASGQCQCYRRRSALPALHALLNIENTIEDNLKTAANELVDDNEVSEAGLGDCNWRWCETRCRNMGYSDGTCRNGRCECDHRRHSVVPLFTKLNKNEESVKQCSSNSCLQFCRHHGFRFSHCENGNCQCYR